MSSVVITANKRKLIDGVRQHAQANYTKDCWDVVVECYSDEDILIIVGESFTVSGAIAKVAKFLKPYAAYKQEIEGA